MTEQAPPAGAPDLAPETADVVVVGAGPAGSAVAYYLATAGLDVLVLEKSRFPREKVCGDGLTPRAVKALTAMGVAFPESDGWLRNKGLRIIGGGGRIELDWPAQRDLAGQIAAAGWAAVRWRSLMLGVVAVHSALRPGRIR